MQRLFPRVFYGWGHGGRVVRHQRVCVTVPICYLAVIGVGGMALSMVPLVVSDGQPWTILTHTAIWGIAAGG